MKVLVTGSDGFIAKNLVLRLVELGKYEVLKFSKQHDVSDLSALVEHADCVVHLAGVNRPKTESEFDEGNAGLTDVLCQALLTAGRKVPVIYSSSAQATADNAYGRSKRKAEDTILAYSSQSGAPAYVLRLPNIFGKWAKPNYNSAVATFCNNIANDLPITIHNPDAGLSLLYVDDLVDALIQLINGQGAQPGYVDVGPVYQTTVGKVADVLHSFKACPQTLIIDKVGTGLIRALYSTYVSYLTPEQFSYKLPKYGDPRGEFVEMLKTTDAGQFSYFTAHPGVTRGGHYHHSKTEKFLVIRGEALFRFRHMLTGETSEIRTKGGEPEVVDTVPGWTHDITNVGETELVVMLWANEIFDRNRPDTITASLVN